MYIYKGGKWLLWHLKRNSYPEKQKTIATLAVEAIQDQCFCVSPPFPNPNAWKSKISLKPMDFSMFKKQQLQLYIKVTKIIMIFQFFPSAHTADLNKRGNDYNVFLGLFPCWRTHKSL